MIELDQQRINERVQRESAFMESLMREMQKVIVGQSYLLDRLLIGLLANGHILLEGVPGLAKTLAVKTFADTIKTTFKRIQFTPDLLPADLIGTMIYNPKDSTFYARKGPVFTNILLADEINRAPAKVQSALLEAMQERQVTIGETAYKLDEPFMVLATENPIEHEGTYPLPEAQIDRFMLKLRIDYPDKKEEKQILERMAPGEVITVNVVATPEQIFHARRVVKDIYIDERIKDYIIDIVFASRFPEQYGLNLKGLIQYGASPRASIFITQAAKAHAFVRQRGYVTPDDVKSIGYDILRHRIILSYEAEAEEITTEDVVRKIFDKIPVP